MSRLALLLILTAAQLAHADNSPIIWQGANSKDLTSGGLITPKVLLPSGGTPSASNKATVVAPALAGNVTLTTPAVTSTLRASTDKLSDFAATTSVELDGVISDDTGSGALCFATSPTLVTPVIAQIVNGGTLTLPSSTDTLVGKATSDVLTNKTIDDDDNTIQDVDLTTFAKSGTLLPVASGGTNKSLTLGAGRLPYLDADSFESLAAGTQGQRLVSQGAAAPIWSFSGRAAKSADYTVLDGDGFDAIDVTTSTSTITITLPTAADNTGRVITVRKVDSASGKVTVDGEGSETVSGDPSVDLALKWDAVTLMCDGTGWVPQTYYQSLNVTTAPSTGGGTSPTVNFLRAVRVGSIVTVSVSITTGSGSPGTTITWNTILPSWARPNATTEAWGNWNFGSDFFYAIEAASNGDVTMVRGDIATGINAGTFATATTVIGQISYSVNR